MCALRLRCRVLAALRAAALRRTGPLLTAAVRADAARAAGLREAAARCAWRDSAVGVAAAVPSRSSAFRVARLRRGEGARSGSALPRAESRSALFRVCSEVVLAFGGASATPARRAFDRPMAIACLLERAPCLPSRTCSISSRTNSPAWVLADFPCALSLRARALVRSSGMLRVLHRMCQFDCHGRAEIISLPAKSLSREVTLDPF